LSTSLAAALNFWLLVVYLPRKIGRVEMAPLGRYALALTAASLVGGGAAWLGNGFFLARLGAGFWPSLASLVLFGSVGLAVFYAASRVLGIAETRDFARRFLRR
jgi:peptidoglycan biosynthesis protein MviN/MurJ (putative lipid II flippase)